MYLFIFVSIVYTERKHHLSSVTAVVEHPRHSACDDPITLHQFLIRIFDITRQELVRMVNAQCSVICETSALHAGCMLSW